MFSIPSPLSFHDPHMNRLFLLSLLATPAVFAQTAESLPKTTKYTVVNKCPQTIDLYIAGKDVAKIATGHDFTTTLGPNPGFFYTDVNGGNKNGAATRAGFFTDVRYTTLAIPKLILKIREVCVLLHRQGCRPLQHRSQDRRKRIQGCT